MNSICRTVLFAYAIIVILGSNGYSQRKALPCSIGTTRFLCPSGQKKLKDVDNTIRIFKDSQDGEDRYFFIAILDGVSTDSKIRSAIADYYLGSNSGRLEWKKVDDPLVMSMKTKYVPKISSQFGLLSENLIEIKTFIFDFNNKRILIGYADNFLDEVGTNRKRFQAGKGFSDNAASCNDVVTTLNSITKEFKEKDQYCFLSALAPSN